MSVLLDALKKSEEEKKKSEGEAATSPEGGGETGSQTESAPEAPPAPAAPAPAKPAAGGGIGKLGMFSHSAPAPKKPHVTRRPAGPGAKPPGAAAPGTPAPAAPAPAPTLSVATKPQVEAPASPPPSIAAPTAGGTETFDFDAIDEPATPQAGTGISPRASQTVESRTVAGSVVGAGESAVDAGGESSTGGTGKLALAAAVLAAIGGGAYYFLFSGPSGPASAPATAVQSGSEQSGQAEAELDPADQLPLPNPNIDIQSELVSFASYTSNTASTQDVDGVAERIAVLTSSFLEQDTSLPQAEDASAQIDLAIDEPVAEGEAGGVVGIDPATYPLITAKRSRDSLVDRSTNVDLGPGVRLYAVAQEQDPEAFPEGSAASQQAAPAAPAVAVTLEPSEKANIIRRLLDEAKREFDAGNLAAAEVAFRKILADDLNNINAMKGLAMVASETGRYRLAASVYLKVLDLQPDDAVAISELISLHSRQADYQLTERKLRGLIGRVPAHDNRLFFALGNVYAEQGRWREAQEQYFTAYSADSRNPDYAFNLAVSLEYIGRQDIALNYYKIAQELAETSAHSFEDSVLTTRILQLDN